MISVIKKNSLASKGVFKEVVQNESDVSISKNDVKLLKFYVSCHIIAFVAVHLQVFRLEY